MGSDRSSPALAPSAPWRLLGECVLAWVRAPRALGSLLPEGVKPLPGPAALVGASYQDSPVGPFLELSLGLPARIGLRPGLCVVFQVVSLAEARSAYRGNWGLPATVGPLSWSADATERILRWEEPGIELRGVPVGPALPALVPIRSVQRRTDGPVVLPRRFFALVRLARTSVTVEPTPAGVASPSPSSPAVLLAGLAGDHPGAVMSGMRVLARPARHPAGLWSSLRAPLVVPEPALAGLVDAGGAGPAPNVATVTARTGRLAQLVRAQPSHG